MTTSLTKTYRRTGLAVLLVLCLAPGSQSWAVLSSSAPVGTGKIVKGCCSAACAYTIGWIAKPKNVRKAWDWFDDTLSDQVEDMGESLQEGEQKIPAVLNKRFEAQNALFRSLLTSYGFAHEKSRNNKMFGPQSAAYASWDRSGYVVGQGAGAALDVRMRQGMKEYAEGFQTQKQIAARLNQVSGSDLNPQCVFPANGTLTKQQGKELLVSLKTIIGAFPTVEAPESYRDTRAGQHYRAIRKARRFRAQVSEAILTEVAAGYMPTMSADDGIREMWQASGGQGDPAQVKDDGVSPVGYLGFLIRSRFANSKYRTGGKGSHAMPPAGLLRELASVTALRMAVKKRQLRRSQQIAFLLALQVSGRAAAKNLMLQESLQKTLED